MITKNIGRPTWVSVDLSALKWNLHQVRHLVGSQVRILAVVKANAYGHGAVACSRALLSAGADELGVATVEEAEELRRARIRHPIVVFGLIQPQEVEQVLKLRLQPTVVSESQLRVLSKIARKKQRRISVHLKVDTGMGRIGIQPQVIAAFFKQMKKYPHLTLRGIFTHFAHADGRDKRLLRQQMHSLYQAADLARQFGYAKIIVHASNSAAVINAPETYADMVRPGLMLYGLYPAKGLKKLVTLKPVLRWSTRIIQVKCVPAGTGLSYGHTFITRRPSQIATLPVGYADGFSRALSNQGEVIVKGRLCPVVGRVCMDMCLVDVTAVKDVAVGDEVILIGRQGKVEITAETLAERLNTISYEVVSVIGSRVPRIFQGGCS